ncbi:40S ribosomal protein S4-3 [Zea mays]|uniref:40S ribosomal protein S4-3 n=1 Tax=Zea mays TaxID=4577 RepID=A0A1D6LIV8_MAIZE|nr:40S ribosomal protein S4-3 [Zea mays]
MWEDSTGHIFGLFGRHLRRDIGPTPSQASTGILAWPLDVGRLSLPSTPPPLLATILRTLPLLSPRIYQLRLHRHLPTVLELAGKDHCETCYKVPTVCILKISVHFEKDKALARRFQPVLVNEPSQEDAVKILLGLREKYETYHKCKYTLEGINAAVYLSARYIPDRYLPDKAIDLIDEAGSRAQMESFKRKKEEQCSILSKSPDEYWQEIRAVQSTHEVALANRLKYSLDENDKEDVSRFQATILAFAVSTLIWQEYKKPGLEDIKEVELFIWSWHLTRGFKLCKVRSVQFGQKGIPYLNTYDGCTICYPNPLIKANDTIKIDLETNKIMDFIKLDLSFHGLHQVIYLVRLNISTNS